MWYYKFMLRMVMLLQLGRKYWGYLATPRHLAPNTAEYRRYTILNTVIISLIATELILLPLVPIVIPRSPTGPIYVTLLTGLIVCATSYILAHKGFYVIAATTIVSLITGTVCGLSIALDQDAPIKFLALSSVLGVILFSRIGAWRVLMLNLVAGLVTAKTLPGSVMDLVTDDLLLILMLSMALLLTVATTEQYLHQIQAQHAALLESQKRELNWVAENERARVMREWVSYMSHDFRTPLAVMSTILYVMERNHKPELNAQRIQTLNGQVERLTSLVNYVHAAVSLDHEVKLSLVVQEIVPLIHEVVDRLAQRAAEHKVTIEIKLDEPLPRLPLDTDGFRLALECLLENAIEYNKTAGLVTVRPTIQGAHLHLTIEDTGIGISAKDMPFIFDRFYRADKARQIERGRNGLGLSIAKMVVEAHHGRIEVKSVLGTGSAFTLVFPLQQPE